jgi:hypothetical protein
VARKFLHNYSFKCLAYAQTVELTLFIHNAMTYFDFYNSFRRGNTGSSLIEVIIFRDNIRCSTQLKSQKLLLMINTYTHILSWILDRSGKYDRVRLTDWSQFIDYSGCTIKVLGFNKKHLNTDF